MMINCKEAWRKLKVGEKEDEEGEAVEVNERQKKATQAHKE